MTTLNGVSFTRTGNPQADLVSYANARGISQAQAKTELQSAFGDPKVEENVDTFVKSDSKDENVNFEQALYDTLNSNNGSINLMDFFKMLIQLFAKLKDTDAAKTTDDSAYTDIAKATDKTEAATSTSKAKSSSTTSSSSSSTSSASSSSSFGGDSQRNNIQNGMKDWTDKFNQAMAVGDKNGAKMAAAAIKGLQGQAYNLDMARAYGLPPR